MSAKQRHERRRGCREKEGQIRSRSAEQITNGYQFHVCTRTALPPSAFLPTGIPPPSAPTLGISVTLTGGHFVVKLHPAPCESSKSLLRSPDDRLSVRFILPPPPFRAIFHLLHPPVPQQLSSHMQ